MCPLDLERLRFRREGNLSLSHPKKPPRLKRGGKFLKGPVPLDWLAQAGKLPGKCLHLGDVLWFLVGLKDTRTVPLLSSELARFGVNRQAKYRALHWLENAGLITVERHPGRNPVVTILEAGKSHER